MTYQSYSIDSADTREAAPFEQLDYRIALLTDYQCRLSLIAPTRQSFTGRASRQRTATYQLISWTSEGSAYQRSRQDIPADPDGDYRLTVTELAHRLEFSAVSAFSSSFRERSGRAPSTVRTES